MLGANFPTSPAGSLLQDSLTPARLHLPPVALEHAVPSLGIALTTTLPPDCLGWAPGASVQAKTDSLPRVPSLPWIHHTMCDAQGHSMVCSVSGSLSASALQEGKDGTTRPSVDVCRVNPWRSVIFSDFLSLPA